MLKILIMLASLTVALSTGGWIKHPAVREQISSDDSFIVGIFRPDGVIVPFAHYSNRKWTNPWHAPQPSDQAAEPETIADLSKPWYESSLKPSSEWYLLLSSGDARSVRTSKNVQVCSHCQHVWGLLTDYPDPKQPEKNSCVRNLAVAFSQKTDARAMEQLTNASPDWKQVMTWLRPSFERAEKTGLAGKLIQEYSRHVPPAEERAKSPVSIINLYRVQLGNAALFHFAASKQYPGCYISLLDGWALRDALGKLVMLHSQFSPTDCDMKEGDLILPFAILQLDGKTFAIVEEDSYEGESYTILEIRKNEVRRVLETIAGSC